MSNYRALRNSLNENLLASPIITNSNNEFNGKSNESYGRQSLDALAAAALQASISKTSIDDCDKWMTVGVFKTLTHNVVDYVDLDWQVESNKITSENLPELNGEKMTLEPGRAYRFRVAGINACGIGEFSEVRCENNNCL